MIFTIDPYYNTKFYNESLEALKNNKVVFSEYISIKTPYNWYLKIEKEPIMVNYDIITPSDRKFIVTKVIALRENEEYYLQRRNILRIYHLKKVENQIILFFSIFLIKKN